MTHDEIIASVVDWILREEGGVADVGDGKGLTRWGQTTDWLTQWGMLTPTTRDEARSNYTKWMTLTHLDAITDAGELFLLVTADYSINAGEGVGIPAMQRVVGVAADGIIGSGTVTACRTLSPREALAAGIEIVGSRVARNGALITDKPEKFARYAKGWAARCERQMKRVAKAIRSEE